MVGIISLLKNHDDYIIFDELGYIEEVTERLINCFKLKLASFKKKKPNVFQLANSLRSLISNFEDRNRISN